MEAIAYQRNDRFGPDLEEIIQEYVDLVKAKTPSKVIEGNKVLKERFAKVVKDRIGMTVYLITNSYDAATIPNVLVEHSAMNRDAMRQYFEVDPTAAGVGLLKAAEDGKKLGTVNTETVKVTGWMAEQPIAVFMNFEKLLGLADFTTAELTAIVLHELGHDFEAAAMANRANHNNQVLADLVRHIKNKDRGGSVEYIYRELKSIDPKLEKETIEGLFSGDTVVMGVSAFRLIQGTIRSISGSSVYNRTAFESMADSFAVRFGYASPLASGLDKLLNDPARIFNKNLIMVFNTFVAISTFMSVITMLTLLFKVRNAASLVKLVISLVQNMGLLALIGKLYRTSSEDYAYDRDNERLDRIRKNVLEMAKNPEIDKKTKIALIEQLKELQTIVKNTPPDINPLQKVLNLVFKGDWNSATSIAAQKQIEDMIANDLFISSMKLSNKA